MFLALDAGNTFIKAGYYDQNILVDFSIHTYEDLEAILKPTIDITHAAISSVVPEKTYLIKSIIQGKTGIDPYIITHKSNLNIVLDYRTPDTLGIDRICSCEGALSFMGINDISFHDNSYIVTVDMGTATTINIVRVHVNGQDQDFHFLGGLIAPGVQTMFKSLFKGTAQLPLISSDNFEDIIGKDTGSSMASGVIISTISMIEKIINFIEKEQSAASVELFLTGGNAHIRRFLDKPHIFMPDLVLRGVKSIYGKNFNVRV